MKVHENARMTVHGRLLLVRRVPEAGWRVADAASAAGVSERTAYTWLTRYRAGGERALVDRSSAPVCSPRRLSAEAIASIERLRRQRWMGPRIARAPGRPVSTVGTVLRRLGLGRLSVLLGAKPPAVRYERSAAGELLHLDSKKLGRIDGLGHRVTGDRRGHRARGAGWEYLHVAIDDASRLAYTELLPEARTDLRRLPRPRRHLVRRPRRSHRAGHDRQCLRLHQEPRVQGRRWRPRRPPPDDPALHAPHQR
jgi:transposase